jgi:hypothetical protein
MKTFEVGEKVWYMSGYRFHTGTVTKVEPFYGMVNRIHITCDTKSNIIVYDYYVFATDEEVKKEINFMISNLQGDLILMERDKKYQVNCHNE